MEQKDGWQLSGDGPSAYEKYMVPAYTESWAKELVERAGLEEGKKVLDIACGTGIVARIAAGGYKNSEFIYGVDINAIMLEKAYEINKSINWRLGNVTDLPFYDSFFDVILCQQGLQYFSDPVLALKEMNRILVDNGSILASVWRPIEYSPFYKSLHQALEKYVDVNAADTLLAAFTFNDRKKLRELFENAGFKHIKIHIAVKQMHYSPFEEFVIGGMAASPFYNTIKEMETQQREEMLLSLCKANDDYMDDDGLAAPMESYIISAYKGVE